MKVFAILALCIAASHAGVVEHTRCGGVGMFQEMRIQNCEGPIAYMLPATSYPCEGDIIPSTSAPALRLRVTAFYLGSPIPILDVVLQNSSVQQGQPFTVRFTITPSDLLSGNTLPVNAEVLNEGNGLVEVCVTVQVNIA